MKDYNSKNVDAVYLAKWMDNSLSNEELRALVSESDFTMYKKLKSTLNIYERLEVSTEISFREIDVEIKKKEKKKKIRKLYLSWSIAASVVILFGLFTLLKGNDVLIQTNFGEQVSTTLPDNSEVVLNSKSTITYNTENWQTERTIFLNGEAYFKVEKGSTFTVNTKNGSVTVLGTEFNVNSKNDYFEVVCYEGKVSVTTSEKQYVLTPSNTVRKISENAIEKRKILEKKPSWTLGESTFKSAPIKYVILALEEKYNVVFEENQINDTLLFTGSFTHSNIDIALKTVFETLEIKYTKKANTIKLSL